MKLGSCKILITSPTTQLIKNTRKVVSLALRQRHLYGRPRRYNTGKEIDPETGLYYFGARYLDPKTSRWLSEDPALGEYVPAAPVNEEARKRNGSLPGMGGVFNYVNLHVYHYAGNNPVKYVDPDGEKSGYVRMADAIGGMGHAGVFVESSNSGKCYFFEITRIVNIDDSYAPRVLTRNGYVNTGGGIIGIFNNDDIAAVAYTFDDIAQMEEFFKGKGYTDYIEFDTTPQQDNAILGAAYLLGREYTNYNIPGNHCGIYAERTLDAGGEGINTLTNFRNYGTANAIGNILFGNGLVKAFGLAQGIALQSPNAIGDQLMRLNNGRIVPLE